jgi:hypothetical protein
MGSTLTLYTNVPGATVRLWSQVYKPYWAETTAASDRARGVGSQDSRLIVGWVVALVASLIAIGRFVFQ